MRSAASIDLDRALAGAEVFTEYFVAWVGDVVLVRALNPIEVERHRRAAFTSVRGIRSERVREERFASELERRALAAACWLPDDDGQPAEPMFRSPGDVARAPASLIDELWRAHLAEMEAVHVLGSWWSTVLAERGGPEESHDEYWERMRAVHAPGLVAFYGLQSARHATVPQIARYQHLLFSPTKAS